MTEREHRNCLIESLAAAKNGDPEAEWVLYEALQDEQGNRKKFKCGQCALRMTVTLPAKVNECDLKDAGVIKIGPKLTA